jgi:hypothetical protein
MENLLLATNQEDVLKKMTPKSQNVEYLRLMATIKANTLPWAQLEKQMKIFEENKKFNYQLKNKISILRLIKSLENASDEGCRQKALDEINKKWFSINFSYPKPATLETGNLGVEIQSGNEEEVRNEDRQLTQVQKNLDDFKADPSYENFKKLNARECLLGLDFNVFSNVNKMDENYLRSVISNLEAMGWRMSTLKNVRGFFDRVMQLPNEKISKYLSNLERLLSNMPLEWIETYFKNEKWANSEIMFQSIMMKKINENLDNPDKMSLETLEEMKEFLMGPVPAMFKKAIVMINLKMLEKLAKKEDFQKQLFKEYLEQVPPSVIASDYTRYDELTRQKAMKNQTANRVPMPGNINRQHGKIVDLYLKHFLKLSNNVEEWEKFFGKVYLQKMFIEVKLLMGQRPEGFEHVFSESEIKRLTEKKEFMLLDTNKKDFGEGEKVSLKVQLKNVEEVRVKVFQVNVEQALLENMHVDYSKMDLLGLVAKEEYVYKYEKEPLERWMETFEFGSIEKVRRGVFIIDFLAGRISSRAIITKGRLILLSEKKKLGTMCVILDEKKKICRGRRTGLYIHGKFYAVDEAGVIYLPNNDSSLNGEVIVCHEDFATISSVEVSSPSLNLTFDVVFNREQLRTGNSVDLILFPMLTIYDEPLDLSNVKNTAVSVTFASEEGNSKTIDFNEENNNSIQLKQGSFSKVSVTLPPKTICMNISMSGDVCLHGKDKFTLAAEKRFNFVGPSRKQIEQVYLNYDNEKGYVVKSKGRNGEPISNQMFNLNVTNPNMSRSNTVIRLKTKGNGERVLGHLPHAQSLRINISGRNDTDKNKNTDHTFFYTKKMLLAEGDGLLLPISNKESCHVIKGSQNKDVGSASKTVLENFTSNKDHVTFGDSVMMLKNLEKGTYHVAVGPSRNEEIEVQVIEGERFEIQGRRFIQSKNQIVQLSNEDNFWRLQEDKTKGVRIVQGNVIVKGKPLNPPQSVEAVVLCHNYICEDADKLTSVNNSTRPMFLKQYKLSENENRYFNNKKLDEEILYVLRRRNLKEFMGNTLEKPTMLLKRQKVMDTYQEDERLAAETGFNAKMGRAMDTAFRRHCKKKTARRMAQELDLSTDFLKVPGVVVTEGLSLDKENYLQVPCDQIKDFNHVYVVFNLGGQVILTKTLKNQNKTPDSQSLVLRESKKEGYVYRNIRQTHSVSAGASHKIESIDKTEYRLIKSLADLSLLMPGLNSGVWNQLKEWSFLSTWNKLSPVEKLKKYDEFISHEMNLFLRYKDAQFFEEVVGPHIQNKREKTIVDHFLLGNQEELSKYLDYGRFQKLSLLEMVLVICCMSNDVRAQNLGQYLMMQMDLPENKKSEEDFKRVFDKIIETTEKEPEMPTFEPPQMMAQAVNNICNSVPVQSSFNSVMPPAMRNYAMAPPPQPYANAMPQRRNQSSMPGGMNAMRMNAMPMMMQVEKCMEQQVMLEECRDMAYQYEDEEEDEAFMMDEGGFIDAGAEVYKGLESTTEYEEKKFFFANNSITWNVFYSNLLCHAIKNKGNLAGFIDSNFIYCVNSPTEIILLFALLDLSFENVKPKQELDQFTLTLSPANNCMIFSKQISEVKGESLDLDFLISQRFYDPSDRYYYLDDGTKAEKPVKEFKKGKIYGSRVVVTNSTVSSQKVSIVTEIPQGSLPVNRADTLRALPKVIESFRSEIIEFQFYFPDDGKYTIYPSTVAKGDKILATSKSGVIFEVGKKVQNTVMESISDILSGGKIEDILEFLRTKNILNHEIFQFESIGWLLNNEKVWRDVIKVYRERGIYDYGVWSFGFKYNDMETVKEFFNNEYHFGDFNYLQCSLGTKDTWETKDYFPLVNPRAHSVNQQNANILNKQFKTTYENMLKYLLEKQFFTDLTLDDRILWITYLLLQDRIQEASEMFASISKSLESTNPVTVIQKDYLEAYLDFMTGYPTFAKSKEICQKYLSYPVLTWRNLFVEIANQLAEYENEDFEADVDETQKAKTRVQQADESPFVEAEIVEDGVKISFKNQKRMHLEFYQIDLEVLFSQDPYEEKLNSSLTKVLPFLTETHKLTHSPDFQSKTIAIPENLQTQNLLIRVVDDSRQSSMLKYVPFKLNSSLNEKYGILKLTDPKTGKPIPKVYVKCFCRNSSGSVKFYKDGYTDLRGSFDFAAVSSNNADNAESFKILVNSREFGAKIFSAKPPVSSVKKVGTAKKIRSSNWRSMNKKHASKNLYAQTAAMF